MEDLDFYFEDMIEGPDGENLYFDIMRLRKEFEEMISTKEIDQ